MTLESPSVMNHNHPCEHVQKERSLFLIILEMEFFKIIDAMRTYNQLILHFILEKITFY
jgi:hypothetical protein